MHREAVHLGRAPRRVKSVPVVLEYLEKRHALHSRHYPADDPDRGGRSNADVAVLLSNI